MTERLSVLKDAQLEYYDLQSRAEPIRFLLADLGVNWTDVTIDEDKFEVEKMDLERYPFNQVPILSLKDGRRLAQKNAILRYVCGLAGYVGSGDLDQELVVNQLECAVEDLQMHYVARVYSPRAEVLLLDLAKELGPKVFTQLEHILSKSNSKSGFFVYDDFPSPPEYSLLYLVGAIQVLRPDVLEGFEKIKIWNEMMRNRKGLKEYLESGRQTKMLNASEMGQRKYC